MRTVVTGATGPVVTRDRRKAPAGVDVVEGDFTQENLPAEAFADVRRAFVFPAQGGVGGFLRQAKQAGTEQLVVMSSLAAAMDLTSRNHCAHRVASRGEVSRNRG